MPFFAACIFHYSSFFKPAFRLVMATSTTLFVVIFHLFSLCPMEALFPPSARTRVFWPSFAWCVYFLFYDTHVWSGIKCASLFPALQFVFPSTGVVGTFLYTWIDKRATLVWFHTHNIQSHGGKSLYTNTPQYQDRRMSARFVYQDNSIKYWNNFILSIIDRYLWMVLFVVCNQFPIYFFSNVRNNSTLATWNDSVKIGDERWWRQTGPRSQFLVSFENKRSKVWSFVLSLVRSFHGPFFSSWADFFFQNLFFLKSSLNSIFYSHAPP